MTPAEYFTTQFYTWEYRGRGWNVADEPIQLEPPFIPFFRHGYHSQQIDDGKRHTLASKVVEKLKGKQNPILIEGQLLDYETLEQFPYINEFDFEAVQIKLPKDRKITTEKMKALLLMLSYSNSLLSFEIIGTAKEIVIQFVCSRDYTNTLTTYIKSYFPQFAIIQSDTYLDGIIQPELPVFVVDFGLKQEFVRPIQFAKNFSLDPCIAVIGVLERLNRNEQAGFQILFQPAVNHWSESILRSVTLHDGTSFFSDVPEAPKIAIEKVHSPLYGVTIRAFAQAEELKDSSDLLEKISVAIMQSTKGTYNELIPLSNADYDIETRLNDIILRESHRMGMLLNLDELITLLHFPSESIVSNKLFASTRKTTETPAIAKGKTFVLGENSHNGIIEEVSFGIEERLKHTHIIGATGTGKSTLIANLVLQDIEQGFGVVLFDPHGDLVDDILSLIPVNRLKDVVLVDSSDTEYPVALNILQAKTDIEKEVLSSDLVASFRKYATSWGDQMSAVLGNAILAILESFKGGTLHDLRRFLIEKEFRNSFLKHVTDPTVQYYWQKEFPLLKSNSIGPILTRLDTFLRPKSIRNMLVQNTGLDFEQLLNTNKIILFKLSQGLIGKENSFLLGSLMLSKIHQAVLRRQQGLSRKLVFIYLDEFQYFINPSIKEMISGIRKYNVGLTLSHQDLQQLQREDTELLNNVFGNVNNRIVFRVGEPDAKKLQDGFIDFDFRDLQNLGRGEAVIRIEQPQYNCSLTTYPTSEKVFGWPQNIQTILENSRRLYATPKEEVERILLESLNLEKTDKKEEKKEVIKPKEEDFIPEEKIQQITPEIKPVKKPEEVKPIKEEKDISTHRYLQTLVKKMAESRGYIAVLEAQLPDGSGQVDVLLTKENKTIAVEICVTTDADWEMHNVFKCLTANYDTVISLSGDPKQLEKIKKKCIDGIKGFETKNILFLTPDALFQLLDESTIVKDQPTEQIIKGYRVNVTYDEVSKQEMDRKRASVTKVVMDSMRKFKKKE